MTVKIQTNEPISEKTKEFTADRFLVQLSKVDNVTPNLDADQIKSLWQSVANK